MNYELVEQPLTPSTRAETRRLSVRTPDPDAHLVARWQEGEPEAFEALVVRHQGPSTGCCDGCSETGRRRRTWRKRHS